MKKLERSNTGSVVRVKDVPITRRKTLSAINSLQERTFKYDKRWTRYAMVKTTYFNECEDHKVPEPRDSPDFPHWWGDSLTDL